MVVQIIESLFINLSRDLRSEQCERPTLVDHDQAACFPHGLDNRVDIKWPHRAWVDHLTVNALLGHLDRGLEVKIQATAQSHDRAVIAVQFDVRDAKGNEMIFVRRDGTHHAQQTFRFQKENRIIGANGRLEKSLGVPRRRGDGHLKAGHLTEQTSHQPGVG